MSRFRVTWLIVRSVFLLDVIGIGHRAYEVGHLEQNVEGSDFFLVVGALVLGFWEAWLNRQVAVTNEDSMPEGQR